MQIKSLAKNGLFWLVLLVLLILRRPDQLFHAYIWDEDKNIILQWFELGTLKTFLAPINGYLVTVPKLINYFGLKLSFAYYPEISTGLAILFNLFSILMVAYAPNLVGWRKLAALAVIVVPTGAEIYILPLYTLWFAGLLLIIVLLWQMTPETKGWYLMRALLVCIGGSSSPLIVALMPAFWLRFIILKRRREAIIAAMSTVFAAIQGWFIYANQAASHVTQSDHLINLCLDRFLGMMFFYFAKQTHFYWALIYGTLVLFAWLLWRLRKQKLDHFWFQLFLFGYIFLTVIAVNGLRVDLSMIHPYIAAPRYFFYPFVSLAFFLCWLGYHSDRLGKIIAIGMLLLAISNGLGHYSQPHDRMNWRGDVAQCLANKEGHHFSSFFDGKATTTWDLYLTHEQCEQLSD